LLRDERHQQLLRLLTEDPLQTDQRLAERLGVSVPTIRLDRMTLGVPALPKRSRDLAEQLLNGSPLREEINSLGELVALERGIAASARILIQPQMAVGLGGSVPSYFLLAHAERLVYSVVGGDVVLTAVVNAKSYRPVRSGEMLESLATVVRHQHGRVVVLVEMTSHQTRVFRAKYAVNVMADALAGME